MENMKELKINLSGNSVLKKSAILKIKHLLDDSSLKEVRNVTIPVPRCENRDCWKCGQRLEFPLYWLRWEEGDVLGCIKCVEEKSTKEGHHFAYEKNSILLLEQWDAIRMHRMGNNLSPKNIPAHTQKHTYYCNIKSL